MRPSSSPASGMADASATASTALQSISLADLLPPRLHTRCFGPSIDTILRQGAGAAEHVAITAAGKKEEAGELARSLPHVSVASASRRLRWATVESAQAQAQSYAANGSTTELSRQSAALEMCLRGLQKAAVEILAERERNVGGEARLPPQADPQIRQATSNDVSEPSRYMPPNSQSPLPVEVIDPEASPNRDARSGVAEHTAPRVPGKAASCAVWPARQARMSCCLISEAGFSALPHKKAGEVVSVGAVQPLPGTDRR